MYRGGSEWDSRFKRRIPFEFSTKAQVGAGHTEGRESGQAGGQAA